MPVPINRTQLRKELHRSGFVGNLTSDEAASAFLRRVATGDYRVAIDSASIETSLNTVNTSVQAVNTKLGNVSINTTQFDQIIALLQEIADNTAPQAEV